MAKGNIAAPAVARALAHPEVVAWLHPTPDVRPIEAAIRYLVPERSGVAMRALFYNRVPLRVIINWRCGLRRPPEWAREIIKEKLQEQADARRALQQQIG